MEKKKMDSVPDTPRDNVHTRCVHELTCTYVVQLCPMDIVHVVDTERGRDVLRKCNHKQAMYSGKLAWCISCHCYDARWTFISTAKCNAQSSTGIASLPDSTKVQRF